MHQNERKVPNASNLLFYVILYGFERMSIHIDRSIIAISMLIAIIDRSLWILIRSKPYKMTKQ